MKLNLTSEEIIGNHYTVNLWKFVMILSNSMLGSNNTEFLAYPIITKYQYKYTNYSHSPTAEGTVIDSHTGGSTED